METTKSFSLCENCCLMAKLVFEVGFHKLKMQMHQAIEDKQKSSKKAKDTSIEH